MRIVGGGVVTCSAAQIHKTLVQFIRNAADHSFGGRGIGAHGIKTIGTDSTVGISAAGDGQFFDQDD